MLLTEPRMAIAWDEGYTLGREERLREWFGGLRDPARFAAEWKPRSTDDELVPGAVSIPPPRPDQIDARSKLLFDPQVLGWFWPFGRGEPHGHPSFYALLGLMGDFVTPSWSELARTRLGPIVLFSLTAGTIFSLLATRWGSWPAALAAGSWVLQPNLFGHGHYASYDAVLSSLWILAVAVFANVTDADPRQPRPRGRWLACVLFGVLLGFAAGTKLTGWFLPIPFMAWTILYRSRLGFRALAVGAVIAPLVLLAIMPPWWTEPLVGLFRFFNSNLSRSETITIPIQFLGTTYVTPTPDSLPWYNTLVWTIFVTPVGFLLLGVLGLWTAIRRWRTESIGVLVLGHWALLMVLRAMPHVPGHDGVRLFLPAFGLLALLGGLGARQLFDWSGRWAKVAIVAALAEGAISVAVMMPVPISYFSPLVGGLPGAAKLGMEPTYYWDALTSDAQRWLTENTLPDRTIESRTFPRSWLYLRRTGELPRRFAAVHRGVPQWIVIQNRPGNMMDIDRTLISRGRKAYIVTKLGVPLIWIFPYSDLERLAPVTNRKDDDARLMASHRKGA